MWKIIKKNSTAKYKGKKVKIKEVLLDLAEILILDSRKIEIVNVKELTDIKPKPKEVY